MPDRALKSEDSTSLPLYHVCLLLPVDLDLHILLVLGIAGLAW